VVVVDGILILHAELVRPHLDLSIFVKTPEDLRFSRRLQRDVAERGRTPTGVKEQFHNQVKPMHDQFVEPSQNHADHVVEGTGSFSSIIQQILQSLP
jgi:uridine kinase